MLTNYLKIAFRNLLKNKVFSLINILGLAIGMAACLLILQYVTFELSYDDFHVNKENIHRLKQNRYDKGVLSTEWAAGGVRKVLGASIASILALLSQDFVKLVLISCVIAIPVAYLVLQNWLHNYAFHINLSWWLFVIPILAVLFIALFTVSFQSLKAALANPVDTLRDE